MKQHRTNLLEVFRRQSSDVHRAQSDSVAKLILMRLTQFIDLTIYLLHCSEPDTTANRTMMSSYV